MGRRRRKIMPSIYPTSESIVYDVYYEYKERMAKFNSSDRKTFDTIGKAYSFIDEMMKTKDIAKWLLVRRVEQRIEGWDIEYD